jgi:hypothetical protein
VSQIDQDVSTALATIREWRNSFITINRVPLDILSLISTHLYFQNDRLRASFVCRHWRRTLLQRAELWSQPLLSKGEIYVKTLLERAKGSALEVTVDGAIPIRTMALFSSHTERITALRFPYSLWATIRTFLEVNPNPLPRLHTLEILVAQEAGSDGFDGVVAPTSPLLFSSAVNLRTFNLNVFSGRSPSFNHFVFPNLDLFELLAAPSERFRVSELLDFLEASPTLRTVSIEVIAAVSFEGVPEGRVITLPNVTHLQLIVAYSGPVYKIATHISCPSARGASFTCQAEIGDPIPEEIFPSLVSLNAIIGQYSRSPAKEVTLDMRAAPAVTCGLIFRPTDATLIELRFVVTNKDKNVLYSTLAAMYDEVFTQAAVTIRNHPQMSNLKLFHITHDFRPSNPIAVSRIANETGELFKSLGPIDELFISYRDPPASLHSLFTRQKGDVEEPAVAPPTKQLTIWNTVCTSDEECAAIVGLAESQHALGVPFERLVILGGTVFAGIEERLRPWVGNVENCYDELVETNGD